jgi:hypothetical protein
VSEAVIALCVLLVVLGAITLVGHAIWVLLALAWKAVSGPAQPQSDHRSVPETELRDVAATQRQLKRLLDRGELSRELFDQLSTALRRRWAELHFADRAPAAVPSPVRKSAPPPATVPAEAILDVLPAPAPSPAAAAPEPPPSQPITLPRRPRRTVSEVLTAFMEEHNILWGELAGGLLIVGCSVALVVYLWQTQKEIRYFPFFVVAGVTAALFGAGMFALRRWKLETTSRGLLIIATLLVPLSFLVLAGLSRDEQAGGFEIGTQIAALGVFAWLVSRAGGVLVGPEQMPGGIAGRWWLTATIVISSGAQLLVPRLVDPVNPAVISFVLLGLATTACHVLTSGAVLRRSTAGLDERRAHSLFTFVGMGTFALALMLGFLVYWCDDPALALERIAALVALAGVPVVATGLIVHSASLPVSLRTAGTGIALTGMAILLAAVATAWPQPLALIIVCAFDFVVLSIVAWRYGLPVAHAAALPCLAVGYLTAYHLLTGGLDVPRAELGERQIDLALSPGSGAALTGLVALLALGAEGLTRLGRRLDGLYYVCASGILAVLSLALVSRYGLVDSGRAALVWGPIVVGGLLANVRLRRPWLTYAAAAVGLGAIVYGLHWGDPSIRLSRLWLLALLLYATASLLAGTVLNGIHQSGARATGKGDPSPVLPADVRIEAFGIPLHRSALLGSMLALLPLLLSMDRMWMGQLAGCTAWLAALWLIVAWVARWRWLFASFQALLNLALGFGVTAWLEAQSWVIAFPDDLTDPRSLQAYGIGLGLLGMVWVSVRLALRRNELAQFFLEPPWPAVDRAVSGGLVLGLLLLAVYGLVPGMISELAPVGEGEELAYWLAMANRAHGFGAWLLLGTLVIALVSALWDRRQHETLLLLILLALVPPLLIAGGYQEDRASASAARWSLAICFIVCSAALWQRAELTREAPRLGIPGATPSYTPVMLRAVLLAGTVAPVLILTAIAAGLRINGEVLSGPSSGTFFDRIGSLTSNLMPLALVSIGLAGHGVRERMPGYAFAAGLVADVTVMGGYVLGVVTSGEQMDDARWVFVVQLGTVGAAAWAGLCLASRHWVGVWREELQNPLALPLMRLQLGMSVTGNVALLLLALGQVFLLAEHTLPAAQGQIGHAAGWLALTLSAAVVFWYVSAAGLWLRAHVLAALGAGAVVLMACTLNTRALPWVSYHVLTAGMATFALTVLGLGVFAASIRRRVILTGPALEVEEKGTRSDAVTPITRFPQARSRIEQDQFMAWVADLVPAEPVRGWLVGAGLALVLLALRGAWTDPRRPYWSVAATMTACVIAAALAVWFRQQRYAYASGLLAVLAGILVWIVYGPNHVVGFLVVTALCFALASFIWSALGLVLRRLPEGIELRGRAWPFAHSAVIAALALIVIVIGDQIGQGWVGTILTADAIRAWAGLAGTAAACGILMWDAKARFTLAGLYATGILALLLGLGDLALSPARFWWAAAASLSSYVLLASGLLAISPALRDFSWRMGVPERSGGWPLAWFVAAQASVAAAVLLLTVWIVLTFDSFPDRLAGSFAVAFLVTATVLLAEADGRLGERVRLVALALGAVGVAEFSLALLGPATPALWLHRNALLLVALAVATAFYSLGLPRLLHSSPDWLASARRIGPVLAVLASVQLFIVLVHEAGLYNPDPLVRTTPLAWWGVLAVAIGLGLLIIAVLRFAIVPGREPFGLSESGRTLYVYAAEMLAVLLLVHLRLNVPRLIPPVLARYWPLAIMGIAFLGVGVAEWFERRGWRVLAEPLRRTGVFLPLLPLLAFWVRDLTGVRETLNENVPALSPLLVYLDRMEGSFGMHAGVWFILGMLYALVAVSRRSFRFALLAALAANFGLWVIFANVHGLHFIAHPQLWLIPLALILLVAEHINRDRLTEPQATALRYLALTMLYVSSTADMFIAGIGNSVLLPIILAVLSVLGILAGILLRVRAFLFQGLMFLFVVVFTMIWHAAVQRGQTWVWYVSGIILGAAILALFALFEKRRNDVQRVMQELKRWE